MTLRAEYLLGHSKYNEFLYAAVGEEKAGTQLTVLSALTRLGFDPWQEAARLSDLPRETAARAFAVTIAMLPEGDWKVSDSQAIATRLVNWLPGRSAVPVPSTPAARVVSAEKQPSHPVPWLVWGALFVALLFFAMYLQADRNLESPSSRETTTQT